MASAEKRRAALSHAIIRSFHLRDKWWRFHVARVFTHYGWTESARARSIWRHSGRHPSSSPDENSLAASVEIVNVRGTHMHLGREEGALGGTIGPATGVSIPSGNARSSTSAVAL